MNSIIRYRAKLTCGWADFPGFDSRNLLLFWVLAGLAGKEQASSKSGP